MWSKQAAPTTISDRNKNNVSSFRSKITTRKSKGIDNKDNSEQEKEKKQANVKAVNQKAGRNRTRKNKKEDNNKTNSNLKSNKGVKTEIEIIANDECDGVVLRNPNTTRVAGNNNSVKRYSDSYVLENQTEEGGQKAEEEKVSSNQTPLTRALSGFFVIDQNKKHNMRFSDLFRPASSKISGSSESLKVSIDLDKNVIPAGGMPTKKEVSVKEKAKNVKKAAQVQQKSENPETNSYLQRVKSRIYKSKSDDTAKIELDNKYKKLKPKKTLDLNGRIPEEDVASPTQGMIQKSLGHFNFGRLNRQTTNLERISRPFGSQKSVENTQSAAFESPVLAKSKSSSAINLSLLRARRAKDQLQHQGSSLCKDEFDFIAFGDVAPGSLSKFPSWLHVNKAGEAKVSQPVSRSGSDRRPEPLRDSIRTANEETAPQPTEGGGSDRLESLVEKTEATMSQECSSSLHSGGAKKRTGGHINRSESVKEHSEKIRKQQRRNISDPSHSNFEVENDRQADLSKNTDSGSSSNSSISGVNGRLSESPSNSMDVHQATVRTHSDSDSDMDNETDPLNWQELVTEEELKKLNPNEKKRQEVINELFLTEASHLRMLKVLYKLFYKSLQSSQMLKPDELNLIFPNIKELLDVHTEINKEMRRRRKEDPLVRQIGDLLLTTLTGPQGEQLRKAAATFCERQQLALEFIKRKRERDNKFDSLLSECEKKRQCRRLQLQGILPYEMQRLTRYRLLLERLIKSVEAAEETSSDYKDELINLRQAHQSSKEILGYVDEAAKQAHNKHRLEEIQRHLDVSNFRNSDHPIVNDFRNIDLTRYKLILEGSLQLRRPNKAPVQVHVLLMEEMVVILQKESDKFLLKFFQSGASTQMAPLSPIIKMNTLLVRENAVCKNALFLVNTSTTSSQMYDLQAEDEIKRETWRKHFSDAAEAYNRREGKPMRLTATLIPQSIEPVSDTDSEPARDSSTEPPEPQEKQQESPPVEDPQAGGDNVVSSSPDTPTGGGGTGVGGGGDGLHVTTKVSAEEWPLIQPSQVNVELPPVHTAESMLTPLEQIRRKDALVKQTLMEKEDLVADLLAIPREHFEHIADLASATSNHEENSTSDITDRLLASVFQVDILQRAVNEALNVSEGDVIAARSPACDASGPNETRSVIPSVPAGLVGDVAASLSLQLTTLMNEIKKVEEDRERLRKELHKVKEQLHVEHNLHGPVPLDDESVQEEVFCEAISEEPH